MSILHFDHSTGRLWLLDPDLKPLGGPWIAANFVDSQAEGVFPLGTFRYQAWQTHVGDGPESPFGSQGAILFKVPGRDGMGLHAGRETTPDGLGRKGPFHCTFGCIRTTEEAMRTIKYVASEKPENAITEITVT